MIGVIVAVSSTSPMRAHDVSNDLTTGLTADRIRIKRGKRCLHSKRTVALTGPAITVRPSFAHNSMVKLPTTTLATHATRLTAPIAVDAFHRGSLMVTINNIITCGNSSIAVCSRRITGVGVAMAPAFATILVAIVKHKDVDGASTVVNLAVNVNISKRIHPTRVAASATALPLTPPHGPKNIKERHILDIILFLSGYNSGSSPKND